MSSVLICIDTKQMWWVDLHRKKKLPKQIWICNKLMIFSRGGKHLVQESMNSRDASLIKLCKQRASRDEADSSGCVIKDEDKKLTN